MPIHFHYDCGRDLLLQWAEGAITLSDLQRLRDDRSQAQLPENIGHVLSDGRRADFHFDLESFRRFEAAQAPIAAPGGKHAVVTSNPRVTAMYLMWAEWVRPEVDASVFSTLKAAYEWLGVPALEDDFRCGPTGE